MKYLIILFVLMNQAMAQQDVKSRSEELSQLRSSLEAIIDRQPYKVEEHSAIKEYFSELTLFVADLESYPKYKKRFNQFLRSSGVEKFCGSILLDKSRWEALIKNCTKNNFFLCSEDVREYPTQKHSLAAVLDNDLKTQYLSIEKCNE